MGLVRSDVYCKLCLKSFLLRVAKDESLFPPKCHHQAVDISTIEAELSFDELTAYRSAELKFTSNDTVDITALIQSALSSFPKRNEPTIMPFVKPVVPKLVCTAKHQLMMGFAQQNQGRAFFECGEMVIRYDGCDHMT